MSPTDYAVSMLFQLADPEIRWPRAEDIETELCERGGWEKRTIPVLSNGAPATMEAMCKGELAINPMLEGSGGFAICLAESGFRLSYGGAVFARCSDAMDAADDMMAADSDWNGAEESDFTPTQRSVLKEITERAERDGKICMNRVFPR